jgi:serine protease Do
MAKSTKFIGLFTAITFLLSSALATAAMSPRQIYKTKASGVVLVVASQEGSSSASAGTGSIIHKDGLVITNSHVIYNAKAKAIYPVVHVFLKPDKLTGDMNKDLTRHFVGEVLAYDKALDLALIKMKKAPNNLTVITLGDPGQLGPGDETIAIGHPEQGGLWTITRGVIGAEFENFKGVAGKHVFQMDTSLNRGNSGGPLFDVRGYQVGVNTAIARKGAGGIAITGVNFAVKASVVKKWTSKHSLSLAYGSEPLTADTRVAVADAAPTRPEPKHPVTPRPDSKVDKTYKDPAGKGGITIEDGYGDDDEGEEYIPEPTEHATTDVARKSPNRAKVHKFKKHYRLRPRPYTYKRLFTEVDRVRDRSKKAFDDLEREIQRRK